MKAVSYRLREEIVSVYSNIYVGEMSAEQLWETTLNPETRYLKRVTVEDGRKASELTNVLMGSAVPPRKDFISKYAAEANIDV